MLNLQLHNLLGAFVSVAPSCQQYGFDHFDDWMVRSSEFSFLAGHVSDNERRSAFAQLAPLIQSELALPTPCDGEWPERVCVQLDYYDTDCSADFDRRWKVVVQLIREYAERVCDSSPGRADRTLSCY